jgi:hypothetical protein
MVAEDRSHMAAIERFIGQKIDRVKLDGFNYNYTSLFADSKEDTGHTGRIQAVRLSGGYYFGPARRRKR